MAPFSTKKHIKTFEYHIHWNINISKNKYLYEEINSKYKRGHKFIIQEGNINQEYNITVMLCTGVTFVKKKPCLVTIIVLFDTAGLHLLTFRILEPYPSEDIAPDFSHVFSH